jgi:hypothetical protein
MPLPGVGAGDQGGTGSPPMPPSPTATLPPAAPGVPAGAPLPPAAGAPGATVGPPAATLAPGTLVPTEMNAFSDAVRRGVQGEDLYNYLPVERRNLIKQMIGGEMPPATLASRGVGAAAQQQLLQIATMIDPGFTPTRWEARNQMVKQLTNTSPQSTGGSILIGNTAIGHLLQTAKEAVKLNNVSGLGSSDLARAANAVRNRTVPQQAIIGALTSLATKYGDESTKFYAGGKGGVTERTAFGKELDPNKSGPELAGVFEAEANALEAKVNEYETSIRDALGEEGVQKYPVLRPQARAELEELKSVIAQLRGDIPAKAQQQLVSTGRPQIAVGTPGTPAAPQTAVPTVAQGAPGTSTAGVGAPGQSGTGAPAAPARTTPAAGLPSNRLVPGKTIIQGHLFLGGDPNTRAAWEAGH